MKAYLINMHLLIPRSRSSAKVKVKYRGCNSQNGRFGEFMFHKHILFIGRGRDLGLASWGKMHQYRGKSVVGYLASLLLIFSSTGRSPASLCHGLLSVVRACVRPCINFFFKHLLLGNYLSDFDEISQKCSCHGLLQNFLK